MIDLCLRDKDNEWMKHKWYYDNKYNSVMWLKNVSEFNFFKEATFTKKKPFHHFVCYRILYTLLIYLMSSV